MAQILAESKLPLLALPAYIPDGYTPERISVLYYLSPEITDPYMQPIETWNSENGNEMQTFQMPEGYRSYPGWYHIGLVNEAGSVLDLFGYFNQTYDRTEFGVSPDGQVSPLSIDGYDHSIFVSDSFENDGQMSIHSYIAAEKKIQPLEFYSLNMLDYGRQNKTSPPVPDIYENIHYQFYASGNPSINETEMVKIIESLGGLE